MGRRLYGLAAAALCRFVGLWLLVDVFVVVDSLDGLFLCILILNFVDAMTLVAL